MYLQIYILIAWLLKMTMLITLSTTNCYKVTNARCTISQETPSCNSYFVYSGSNLSAAIAISGIQNQSAIKSNSRTCLSFSYIQPQNMLKICLSEIIQKRKFHNLTSAMGERLSRDNQNEEILKFVPSRLLKSLT